MCYLELYSVLCTKGAGLGLDCLPSSLLTCLLRISGAKYSGVPQKEWAPDVVLEMPSLLRPKSVNRMCPEVKRRKRARAEGTEGAGRRRARRNSKRLLEPQNISRVHHHTHVSRHSRPDPKDSFPGCRHARSSAQQFWDGLIGKATE